MKKGFLYIILTTFLFSTMEIALKLVSNQFNPIQISFLRFLIGSIVLSPIAIKCLKDRKIKLNKNDLAFFSLTGFICVVVSMTLYQLSLLYCSASFVAILFSCNPVFVIPLAYFLLKEKFYKHTVVSMIISILGMVLIMNPLHLSISVLGVSLVILSALTFALYAVVGKEKSQKYGGIIMTCISFFMGSLQMLALILISKINFVSDFLANHGLKDFANIPILQGINLQTLPSLVYIGIFVTGLGYTFYFLAMEETSAATASVVFFIKPALAPILALIILHEAIALNTVAGIIFIIVGSIVNFIGNNKQQEIDVSLDEEEEAC